MSVGSGDYIFEVDEGWGKLPDGYEFNQVAGVAVDKTITSTCTTVAATS